VKIPEAMPGIPTDEVPLWQRLQDASRSIVFWAQIYEQSQTETHRKALLEAVRRHRELAKGAGPAVGEALQYLLDHVLEDPTLNTPEQLLALLDRRGPIR